MRKNLLLFITCFFTIIVTAFVPFSHFIPEKVAWKMGVALYSFHQHSFEKSLNMAVNSGLKNVEGFSFQKLEGAFGDKAIKNFTPGEIARMKEMLEQRNLNMPSMYIAGAEGKKDWEDYFKMGRQLGIQYFVAEPRKEDLDLINRMAGTYNIKVAIHQHAKPNQYWHPDSVLMAVKGRKNLGVCADIGHWVRSGLNPVKCLQILSGKIIGLHLKDVNTNNEDVVIGTGTIDFKSLSIELKKQKFNGFIQIECEHAWEDNTPAIKEGLHYFNTIANKAP